MYQLCYVILQNLAQKSAKLVSRLDYHHNLQQGHQTHVSFLLQITDAYVRWQDHEYS